MPDSESLHRLLNVPLDVDVGFSGPTYSLSQILALRVGSVIATDHPVGDEIAVYAAKTRIGAGELAAVKGRLVVRMTRFAG